MRYRRWHFYLSQKAQNHLCYRYRDCQWYHSSIIPTKVAICKYVKPYYEACFLVVKSEFVIVDVNYTNPITITIT